MKVRLRIQPKYIDVSVDADNLASVNDRATVRVLLQAYVDELNGYLAKHCELAVFDPETVTFIGVHE